MSEDSGRKLFKKAKRSKLKLKMMIGGPSGSGKTYSSIRIAKGFMGDLENVAFADTEQSAAFYENLGEYGVLDINAPYDPRKIPKVIQAAKDEGIELLIIDSLTHFWEGEGGCLQIHENFGGRFQDWRKTNEIWNGMIDAIVQAPMHVICTVRKKTDYEIQDAGGKKKVQKMGMKNIMRDGVEYEFTCALDLDINNVSHISKDRTGIFKDVCPVVLNEDHGKLLRAWCDGK